MEQGFKKLLVWQKSYALALAIYTATSEFPKSELYGLTSQMRRCSLSVPTNIAEGYERQYRKEYIQFLNIAKGSLGELETQLMFARDLAYLNHNHFDQLEGARAEAARLLTGLIKSLRP